MTQSQILFVLAHILLRDLSGDVVYREIIRKRFLKDGKEKWREESYEVQEPALDDDLPKVYYDFVEWMDNYGGEI